MLVVPFPRKHALNERVFGVPIPIPHFPFKRRHEIFMSLKKRILKKRQFIGAFPYAQIM